MFIFVVSLFFFDNGRREKFGLILCREDVIRFVYKFLKDGVDEDIIDGIMFELSDFFG